MTIRSSVTNSQEKGGLTSSVLARGYGKTTSESSKKMNVPRGDTRLAFHQQVKQALQIISSQSVFETKYRISRPSLGIRAGKLASYQVTLRGNKIHSFLSRFSELWSSQSKPLDTVGTYGMGGPTISPQSFRKVPMASDSRGSIPSVTPNISIPGVKNSSSPYLNDGSKLQSFEDQSLPF
eukprot:COSAG01_NODE_8_length_44037_cov_102.614593_27_plen_180_part_00